MRFEFIAAPLKQLAQQIMQPVNVISTHIKSAAFRWPFRAERRKDEMCSGRQGHVQGLHIPVTIRSVGQEVQHGPIMPKSIGTLRVESGDISNDPLDRLGACTESLARMLESTGGDVENCDVAVALVEKMIHQRGSTAADVNDRRSTRHACIPY